MSKLFTHTTQGKIPHKVFHYGNYVIEAPVKLGKIGVCRVTIGGEKVPLSEPATDGHGKYLYAWPGGGTITECGRLI